MLHDVVSGDFFSVQSLANVRIKSKTSSLRIEKLHSFFSARLGELLHAESVASNILASGVLTFVSLLYLCRK